MVIMDWLIWDLNGFDMLVDGIYYQNKMYVIIGFLMVVIFYDLRFMVMGVYIRCNLDLSGDGILGQFGVDNSNCSFVWNIQYNSMDCVMGLYENDLVDVFLGNNVIMGGDNLFLNSVDFMWKNVGNIEWLDFYFGVMIVGVGEGFMIFD